MIVQWSALVFLTTVFVDPIIAYKSPLLAVRYHLIDRYTSENIFSDFTFSQEKIPSKGHGNFVDLPNAVGQQLVAKHGPGPNGTFLYVEHTPNKEPSSRSSVRLVSKKVYNHALFIADIAHMPGGTCGVWPAFWLTGSNWPKDSEIDIIEGVNGQSKNSMTLHTNAGCSISNKGSAFSGNLVTSHCNVNDPSQARNEGCRIMAHETATFSYGANFNSNGGGVYATEWTPEAISIWFFPRNAIPEDVHSSTPDPFEWGQPMARFAGDCNIDQHFKDLHIVFDTSFCGSWAEEDWNKGSCRKKAKTCGEYIKSNPKELEQAFWFIESVKVYNKVLSRDS